MRYHTAADNQFDVKSPGGRRGGGEGFTCSHLVHESVSVFFFATSSAVPPGFELEEDPGHPLFEVLDFRFRKATVKRTESRRGEAKQGFVLFLGQLIFFFLRSTAMSS